MPERLYHFSDRGDIAIFRPRSPLRHPDAEPLVYTIDLWHSPLYLFPRQCPRIGIWPVDTTNSHDRAGFDRIAHGRMRLFIDRRFEFGWRIGTLYRYAFDPDGFSDCQDHGVWVSRRDAVPCECQRIDDLVRENPIPVEVCDSLAKVGRYLFDRIQGRFTTSLHVSMVRMSNLPDWDGPPGRPTTDRR